MTNDAPRTLDLGEFLNRVEHDEELVRELLCIFQTEAQANREPLHAAVISRNVAEVRNAAHAWKGMLSNLAANRASEAAFHLETLARSNALDELEPAWHTFNRELTQVLQEVEQLLAETLQ